MYILDPLWMRLKRDGKVSPEDILLHFGIRNPPVPVGDLAKKLGAGLTYAAVAIAGGVVVDEDGRATITVKVDDARVRQRFTIAHEIGHLMLHASGPMFAMRDHDFREERPREIEANQFAAELLMPEWMVRAQMRYLGTHATPDKLALMFGVSQGAMARRLDEIFNYRLSR